MADKKFNENMIRCYIRIKRVFYPKDGREVEPGGFATFSAEVVKVKQGNPIMSRYGDLRLKGNVPSLDMDKTYSFCGEYVHHEKFGDQYKIIYMNEFQEITDPEEQKNFLRFILTDHQFEMLYEAFDNPYEIIKNGDIKSLCTVSGITEGRAQKIIDSFENNIDNSEAYTKLIEYGLTPSAIEKLVRQYHGADILVRKIEENPYVLIDDVYGIGWKKADALALNIGLKHNSQFRIEAYVMHFLAARAEEGNSIIPANQTINSCIKELELDEGDQEVIKRALFHLHDVRETLWWSDDRQEFALTRVWNLEDDIAKEIKRLADAPVEQIGRNMDEAINEAENELGIEYTEEQRDAIKKVCSNNIAIVTGLGGCGKSTVVAGVLKVLRGKSFAQTALSGRAAARMQEITGQDGKTIHRLLGYDIENGCFIHNKGNPLEEDIIILDETSMVGAQLFYDLIQAIETGKRFIMIGDDGQLESIGMCNIFKDMLASKVVPVARLTKIHRQAAKSAIITESIKVRNATQLVPYGWAGNEVRGELRDLELDIYKDASESFNHIINQYRTLYNKVGNDSAKIQIVLPQKLRGSICTYEVNNAIQEIVNPSRGQAEAKVTIYGDGKDRAYTLREGDQVIINKNNYELHTYNLKTKKKEEKCPVFNGNRGIIRKIESSFILVDFDQWGTIFIPHYFGGNNIWATLELAYALSCHKLQGSEAPYVIVGMDNSAYLMLTREWLYTAITRAKKYCVICAETHALDRAVKTSRVPYKRTFLKEFLRKEFSEKH